jgi:hypothetical protein
MRIFATTLCAVIAFTGAALFLGCGPNSDGSKLRELEQLQSTLPIFPSMIETSVHTDSKGTLAGISKLYKCEARYDDVKVFYMAGLRKGGWEYSDERSIRDWERDLGGRQLTFRKNEYKFSVTYAGENANYGWDYAIDIQWEK